MHTTREPVDRGMVVPSPLGWQPIRAGRRQPWRWVLGVVAVLVVAFVVLNTITVPYYGLLPGNAEPVNGKGGAVTVGSAHEGSGDIFLTDVLLQPRITVWDRLTDFRHHDDDIIPTVDVTGGASNSQYAQQNTEEMTDSQVDAKVAALRRLGYSVPDDGAAIVAVSPGTPASSKLSPGEVITEADGTPVNAASDITGVLSSLKPGDSVHLELRRTVGARTTTMALTVGTVPCASLCPGAPQRPLMGIEVTQSFGFPPTPDLNISTTGIGGPSAGLAFTLGAIDALTTKDITGGYRVAATGTIDPNGNVGDVGGVKEKTIAVIHDHCQYFIVPTVEYATAEKEAKGHHLTIVPVDTLDQALTFLRSIHGNLAGVPATPPPSAAA
jgi:PDZ domain-containing protein